MRSVFTLRTHCAGLSVAMSGRDRRVTANNAYCQDNELSWLGATSEESFLGFMLQGEAGDLSPHCKRRARPGRERTRGAQRRP
jgi:hypothetical protein